MRHRVALVVLVCATLLSSHAALAQFSQQGPKLVGTGAVGTAGQGYSVSLSADGNTAIVGGFDDNGQAGAAWVWIRSGGVWTQQGTKLVGSDAVGFSAQGRSVALSADGNTAIVGGDGDSNFGAGAAWVWTRNRGAWTQQGTKLVGSDAVGFAAQGGSVALSADGNTAIVGGQSDNSNAGAAWVWTRNGGVWTQQGNKLVGSGAVGAYVDQGCSVSISADGNTAIIGGPGDSGVGAAWVFTRSGGSWTQQGTKLVASGADQGVYVSLSADGNTAMVGGSDAWVWTRSGGVWTQQGAKLVGFASQVPVSLSADGNTAIVGGWGDNRLTGAAWVWKRSAGVWTQQGTKLVGSDAAGYAQQGSSVSLSADGNTAIVGGSGDNTNAGAAWVFTASARVMTNLLITGQTNVQAGSSSAYQCLAQFSDGSSSNVTAQVAWEISTNSGSQNSFAASGAPGSSKGTPSAGPSMFGPPPPGTTIFNGNLLTGMFTDPAASPGQIQLKARFTFGPVTKTAAPLSVTITPLFTVTIYQNGIRDINGNVTLTATSGGRNGAATTHQWDLDGDGNFNDRTGSPVMWNFNAGRTYLVGLRATDSGGNVTISHQYLTFNRTHYDDPLTVSAADVLAGALKNAQGGEFVNDPAKRQYGLVVITHGIYGSATKLNPGNWLQDMGAAIANRLSASTPNICLFDWSLMADPTLFRTAGQTTGSDQFPLFQTDDFLLVRPYAVAQGHVLADWIQAEVNAGRIDPAKPIHLIGHSAGGFLVGECATLLKGKVNVKQVSMLDTPFPLYRHLAEFPNPGRVERYASSLAGLSSFDDSRVNQLNTSATYFFETIPPYAGNVSVAAHEKSHEWYANNTISGADLDGFYFSPFLNNGFHGYPASFLPSGFSTKQNNAVNETNLAGFTAFGSVTTNGNSYTLTEAGDVGIFQTLALPIGIQSVKFSYRFTTAGDGDYLSVHWGTNPVLYVGLDLPFSRSNLVEGEATLEDYAGKTNQLIFKLVSRNTTNAVLLLDQIRLAISDDPDGDGLTTTQELALGTDPLKADTDGDGLNDYAEVNTHLTNPLLHDSDGDGVSDGDEIAADTNPNDPKSLLMIVGIRKLSGASMAIDWVGSTNRTYRVNRSLTPARDSYITLTNGLPSLSPTNTFTDTTATNSANFYWMQMEN